MKLTHHSLNINQPDSPMELEKDNAEMLEEMHSPQLSSHDLDLLESCLESYVDSLKPAADTERLMDALRTVKANLERIITIVRSQNQ